MIALLGGSFDPIHRGHVTLAEGALATGRFTRLFLVPAFQNPLKEKPGASAVQRVALCTAAIAEAKLERAAVLPWEAEIATPSFTIDTVERWRRENPSEPVTLVLGNEVFARLAAWRRPADLLAQVNLLVVLRDKATPFIPEAIYGSVGAEALERHDANEYRTRSGRTVTRLDLVTPRVSATSLREEIRVALETGEDATPAGLQRTVWQLIKEWRLYSVTVERRA